MHSVDGWIEQKTVEEGFVKNWFNDESHLM